MGTDDLYHKRKAKTARDLARKKATRAPYERVLIVCEGRKTEPYYFSASTLLKYTTHCITRR
ncbi:MAG: hypothetical protein A4E57_04133 [Syntrophorhabdaceae bacterium PtaU1.Bin034]|nr:MAG: hypothetical protein A4E57_04133 [Syntrophorhabdaceae bacterium PtaU1.Bin034]